ncbi:MAG: hypothetical protein UX10_C0031G0016 [Candidatus Magasanikbacteria bacterium GW2011_GWA2_45_39]|uniref:Transcriptional repressor PaaX-like central Cas2-like domain-containing protein n=1 Tax=Candidatus Magasanikbacteria bacterium GW2011_GWA2_45_39 TaxID=1619041 RepID=A0A0G1QCV5_9BACT|nr:MAG: hypothetical protein UX10_C0031G0016 [Candidatus Magasanikbacteria bacterium GW2011_GWA2_45_39]
MKKIEKKKRGVEEGQIEEGVVTSTEKKKFERGELRAIVLASVGLVGMVSLVLMAPNAMQMIKLFKKRDRKYQTPTHLRKVVQRMHKQGYLLIKNYGNEEKVILTDKGRYELMRYQSQEKKLQIGKKWDGKWRIVIFDIEEEHHWLRDKIREQIQQFGFQKLQQSVWVYPYECEELVTLLKADCRMGEELLYIVADEIEGEDFLKKKFKILF